MKPHPHVNTIKAWAEGQKVEYRYPEGAWHLLEHTAATFYPGLEYRIAPQEEDALVFRLAHIKQPHRPSIIVVPKERFDEVECSGSFVKWVTDTLVFDSDKGLHQ